MEILNEFFSEFSIMPNMKTKKEWLKLNYDKLVKDNDIKKKLQYLEIKEPLKFDQMTVQQILESGKLDGNQLKLNELIQLAAVERGGEFRTDESANQMFEWLLERFYQLSIYVNQSIKKIDQFPFENFDFNHKIFLQNLP